MYSFNEQPKKPTKLLYINKADIIDSIKDMVRTGESNVGFMIEIVQANWPMEYKQARTLVLQASVAAKRN